MRIPIRAKMRVTTRIPEISRSRIDAVAPPLPSAKIQVEAPFRIPSRIPFRMRDLGDQSD